MTKNNTPKVREYQEDGSFIDRDMTTAEIAQAAIDAQAMADAEAAEAAKLAAQSSAVSKLEAIGLTSEEIAALRG
jgi:hypothetical protein